MFLKKKKSFLHFGNVKIMALLQAFIVNLN